MKYEVRARLFFDEQDEARDFYHDCEVAYPKAVNVNPDTPEMEISYAEFIKNHHDENPNNPCHVISSLPTTP